MDGIGHDCGRGHCHARAAADADMGYAVVPTTIIYPGETIDGGQLQEVEVTNPNLAGDYAKSIDEVDGMISKRTLLPGRDDFGLGALREPYTVTRGSSDPPGLQSGDDDDLGGRLAARRRLYGAGHPRSQYGFRRHRQRHRSCRRHDTRGGKMKIVLSHSRRACGPFHVLGRCDAGMCADLAHQGHRLACRPGATIS